MIVLEPMVKIRLMQTGTTNRKTYRIIAVDESKRRDTRALEVLGFYNPLTKPAGLEVKRDRVDYWISKGAQLSDGAKKLLASA